MINKFCFKKLILLFMSCFIFLSPKPAQATGNQTVINIWHAIPPKNTPLLESLSKTYTDKYHGLVSVNFRQFASFEELHKKLIEGKERPDIALIDTRWQEPILRKNNLVCMEELILKKAGKSVFIVFKMDTFEPMWESSKHNGKLISLPFTGYNRALIINEELFSQYSVDKTPTNWNDLIAIGKQFLRSDVNVATSPSSPFLLPLNESPEDVAGFFQVFMWQMGKDIWQPFLDGELAAFDEHEGKIILKMMVDMIHAHRIASRGNPDKENVAMFIGSPQDYLNLAKQGKKIKVVRWPGNKNSANDAVVYSFVVFAEADENKLDKIWHLLYELCEFRSSLKWALETPFLPNNKQVTLSPGYFAYVKEYPGMKIFVQQLKNSRISVRDERKDKIIKILGENLKSALRGESTVDGALSTSAIQANLILDPTGKLRAKKAEMKSVSNYVDRVWDQDFQE